MDLEARLKAHRAEEEQLSWQGTFLEYFELVKLNPHLAELSHSRVYRMILAKGVSQLENSDVPHYHFFDEYLYGIDAPIAQMMEYFSSAAKRLEVRKRILLLMGPVGGGKSTLVTALKRGLEEFTRSEEGALFAIAGCPMREEPLHLVPEALRQEIYNTYGIYIEGDLCPACRIRLQDEYAGRAEAVRVERIAFSEKHRVGIGTFTPSDPKSQDISELTGSLDFSTIAEYGSESDPRAYRFDGELNISNRGVMEFIEMLKCDEKFLYHLLTLSQEQNIKTGRFAMIYADEVILSHTNENEYRTFIENRKNEALRDRMILVRVPYNLRVRDEVRIYEKLIRDSGVSKVHIAPHTFEVAAMFAVLSRLEESKKAGMTLLKKMKLYDGQDVEGFTSSDVRELHEEFEQEGMSGISPRFVINRLAAALVKDGANCLNPIEALRSLKEGLDGHTGLGKEERDRLTNMIFEVRKEYDETAKIEVNRAFVYSFEESAKTLMLNYLDNVEAFCNKEKMEDPITGEELDPDEKLMRSIEEQIGVTESSKKAFREEILIRISSMARRGQSFSYQSHERLREAIERKLFYDLKNVVKITTSTKTPDQDQLKRMNEVADRMVGYHGYCSTCSNELLRYVGTLLSR